MQLSRPGQGSRAGSRGALLALVLVLPLTAAAAEQHRVELTREGADGDPRIRFSTEEREAKREEVRRWVGRASAELRHAWRNR